MSLRRKSCNACFQGRRKCDLAYPTCQRCKNTGKSCQYVTEPPFTGLEDSSSSSTGNSTELSIDSHDKLCTCGGSGDGVCGLYKPQRDLVEGTLLDASANWQDNDFDWTTQAFPPIASNLLGELGDLLPLPGNSESWQWVVEQLRQCPKDFAKTGENLFIHRSMYHIRSPPAIKAAFGICTASQMVTPATKAMLNSSLESEVSALLDNVEVESIPEDLAQLQAMALFQILRLLSGDSLQRLAAEQQKGVLNAWALRLLQRIQSSSIHGQTYEDLILAESVRRTVMVIYLLHAIGTIFKHGVCTELPTLALLPVSVDPEAWVLKEVSCALSPEGDPGTMKYGEWTDMWVTFPPRRRLDAFQRMLMVACKGTAKVEELEAEVM